VRLVARGPVGGEPLLVQVGFTRFALRISEARRVVIDPASQEGRA
jgi:ferrous iron transport protein A